MKAWGAVWDKVSCSSMTLHRCTRLTRLALREAVRLLKDVGDGSDEQEDHAPCKPDPERKRRDDGLGKKVQQWASAGDPERFPPRLGRDVEAADVVRASGLGGESLGALSEDDVAAAVRGACKVSSTRTK